MNMLAAYDNAMAALAAALQSSEVKVVTSSLDFLDHIKLMAKRVRDRQMIVHAVECQMLVERHLGVLLQHLTGAGLLTGAGGRKNLAKTYGDAVPPATLKEIGVDAKLSMRAKAAAALGDEAFAEVVAGMRTRMAGGKAIIVDPVGQAGKFAEQQQRRADHAARTLAGGTVEDLGALAHSGYRAKFHLLDPQWKFITRSALGEGRSANVHYKTEEVDAIKNIPVEALSADDCAMGMWMVDWCPQDALDLIAHYGFKHITTLFTWVKQNPSGVGFHMGQGYWSRANPEQCYFATRGKPKRLYADVQQLIVAPVMEHSRKPDEQYPRIERLVEGPYLELQARRPREGWTSWGDELPAPLISGVGTSTGATPSSSRARNQETEV
jgi:N6-adenosine-specific RNA methylase IME4